MATQLAPPPAAEPLAPFRWLRHLAVAGLGVLLLAWVAPIFLPRGPLVHWVKGQVEARIDGTVSIGGVSLAWFSPVVLRDVEVRDRDGKAVRRCHTSPASGRCSASP